jgi:predicted nucleic acid-binding Zn ribbon protein
MQSVRDILPAVYRGRHPTRQTEWELHIASWPAAVGRVIAERTRVVGLFEGRLVVEVDDPEWRAQLEALKGRLLTRIRQLTGRDAAREVVFRAAAPGKKPLGRALAPMPSGDEADGIADPLLRRIYGRSRKRAATP